MFILKTPFPPVYGISIPEKNLKKKNIEFYTVRILDHLVKLIENEMVLIFPEGKWL